VLHPVLAMLLVLGALGGLIGGLWLLGRVFTIEAETSRKAVHIGMGLLVLTFPLLFHSAWPVVGLALLAAGALVLLRVGRMRTEGPGKVLLGVKRSSLGDLYFPASVALLFALAQGQWLLYCIPILVLTLADASAALVGTRWGRHGYTTSAGHKSIEGSAAFFAVAFACVFVPLVIWGSRDALAAALIATVIGLVVCALEAISLQGRDNLYVPFAVFVLLTVYTAHTNETLLLRLLMLLCTFGLAYVFRRRTTLDDGALVGAALTGYAGLAVGGWTWLLPPLILLLSYTRLFPNCYPDGRGAHNVHAVVSVTFGGFFCLLLFAASGNTAWYFPYVLSYGIQLALVGAVSLNVTYRNRPLWVGGVQAALVATVMVAAILLLAQYATGAAIPVVAYGVAAVACLVAVGIFSLLQPGIRDCPVDAARWLRQGGVGTIVAVAGGYLLEGSARW